MEKHERPTPLTCRNHDIQSCLIVECWGKHQFFLSRKLRAYCDGFGVTLERNLRS